MEKDKFTDKEKHVKTSKTNAFHSQEQCSETAEQKVQ